MLFLDTVTDGEGEDVKVTKVLNKRLVPATVAILDCADEQVVSRVYNMPEQQSKELEYFSIDLVKQRVKA